MTFEKYTTYSELSKGKWGTPEEMMTDAEFIIGRVLPTNDKKWIKDIEDQSTDQGIKFQATLSGGDVIHMYMVSKWRMNTDSWEFYFNKKRDIQIADAILELFRRSQYIENFNKKHLYLLIREMTDCKTHYITKVVNEMKKHQIKMLNDYLDHGMITSPNNDFWEEEYL